MAWLLSDEHLDAILEAGRWTGSSKNRQSWAIIVIQDRDQLDRLAACGDWCGGPRVEGAFLSGCAAAERTLALWPAVGRATPCDDE